MKTAVLDANALIGFMEARHGAERVKNLISLAREGQLQLLMSVINWGEVYYARWRTRGPVVAEASLRQISQLPIQVINIDSELTKLAASFRVKYRLPYADCFAAALAQQRKATLVTADSDFARVERQVRILWMVEQ